MRIGAIIFSRFDSRRLPGKALVDINGRSLLGRVLDRTKKINILDEIIIATTERAVDNVIAGFAKAEGIKCFRGNLNDVVLRAIEACNEYKLDGFVRVCGDRPFFDPFVINCLIQEYIEKRLDLATTTGAEPLPPGLTGEVVSLAALKDIAPKLGAYDKEHVTTFFYRNPEIFKIRALPASAYIQPGNKIRLVVDDKRDLERARWIASHISDSVLVDSYMYEVISLANRWEAINSHKCG